MPKRIDANHTAIIKRFRRLSCSVVDTHVLPKFVDCVIGKHGLTVLVEIKDGSKPPSARKLTKDEAKLHAEWEGWIETVTCEEDCDSLVNQMYHYANPDE